MENPELDAKVRLAYKTDLDLFLKTSSNTIEKRLVLVFPTINSYHRFKLHELVTEDAEYKDILASFSVGVEPDRRPVICRQQMIAEWALQQATAMPMPVLSATTSTSDSNENNPNSQKKRVISDVKGGGKNKKPDRATYVPKALRNKQATTVEDINAPADTPSVINKSDTPPWHKEIETIVGPFQIVPPLTDYITLQTIGFETAREVALKRVIELGDFPKALKTSDLEALLHSGLGKIDKYYDLRWVDDTHALCIFADEAAAAACLAIKDFQIKFRPFYEACDASRSKAKTFSLDEAADGDGLGGRRNRPDTSTVTAKRMLATALNMPSMKATTEERQALDLKREAKLQAAARSSPKP